MALTQAYLVTTKNLESMINSLVNAKAPERMTNKFLEDLGFKSSNDRLYVGIFKALGLIDSNGVPTQRYFELLDQSQTGFVLAQGIQEAYEDLFNLRKDAQNLSVDEVKNKFKTITQGQKSDNVLLLMANTFKALCDLADWKKPNTAKPLDKQEPTENNQSADAEKRISTESKKPDSRMDLCYNIQIHLPETTNIAVYDAIFQSLKKHIL